MATSVRVREGKRFITDSHRDELLPRLVGAGALAAHGRSSRTEFRAGGIVESVLTRELPRNDDTTPVELALIAAGNARSRDSVPSILALIEKRPLAFQVHSGAADALSAIGDPRAIPVLEEAMRAPDFYALPKAFRALIELRDPQAIPLAIARIEPWMEKEDSFLVQELETVTGQRLGSDRARWQEWWKAQDP
jgi:HEAT repeat protein